MRRGLREGGGGQAQQGAEEGGEGADTDCDSTHRPDRLAALGTSAAEMRADRAEMRPGRAEIARGLAEVAEIAEIGTGHQAPSPTGEEAADPSAARGEEAADPSAAALSPAVAPDGSTHIPLPLYLDYVSPTPRLSLAYTPPISRLYLQGRRARRAPALAPASQLCAG